MQVVTFGLARWRQRPEPPYRSLDQPDSRISLAHSKLLRRLPLGEEAEKVFEFRLIGIKRALFVTQQQRNIFGI
jgi:hypothetical protein